MASAHEVAKSEADGGLPLPRRFLAVAASLLAIVTLVCSGTIVTVALPAITDDFATTPAASVWLVNGFQLALVVSLLPFSLLGERFGQRAIFQAGLGIFLAGAVCSILAGSMATLIAARVVQGLGAAASFSVGAALIRHVYPHSRVGTAIAINAFAVALSSGIGPIAGSFILGVASWPWLFAATIPTAALGLIFSPWLPANQPSQRPFDAFGAVLNAFAFGLFVLAVAQLGSHTPLALAMLVLSAGGFVLLIRHARRVSHPILPLDLLSMPRLAFASAASVLCFASTTVMLTALPFYLINDMQRSQVEVGFLMAIRPFMLAPAVPVSGWLSARLREETLCLAGSVILTLGMVVMLVPSGAAHPLLSVVIGVALTGIGFAVFQNPNNKVLLTTAPLSRSGGAGVILAMSREFGNAFGAGVLGLTFSLLLTAGPFYGILAGALLACMAATLNGVRLWADRRR